MLGPRWPDLQSVLCINSMVPGTSTCTAVSSNICQHYWCFYVHIIVDGTAGTVLWINMSDKWYRAPQQEHQQLQQRPPCFLFRFLQRFEKTTYRDLVFTSCLLPATEYSGTCSTRQVQVLLSRLRIIQGQDTAYKYSLLPRVKKRAASAALDV